MRASNSGDVMDQISHCITDRREVFRLLVSALDTSKQVAAVPPTLPFKIARGRLRAMLVKGRVWLTWLVVG